jgi:hypothetical protein
MMIFGVDCGGARKREEPGARKPIARRDAETKERYGVRCWQERKGSRSLRRIPFMQKAAPTLASCGDQGEVERSPAPPSPSLTLYDQWARAHQSLAWVLEGCGKGRIRTARTARRARIRQESEPSDAHGARGGRAPRGSRYGRKDIHALARRERAVHPARCWDLAPPAGSSLSRGGPGGLCRYIQIGVPPARVSRPSASHNPYSSSPLGHVAYGLRA